jgi:hypothetical protein
MKTSMIARICALMVGAVGLPGCVTTYEPATEPRGSLFEPQRTNSIAANLTEATLVEGTLSGANLTGAHLEGARR